MSIEDAMTEQIHIFAQPAGIGITQRVAVDQGGSIQELALALHGSLDGIAAYMPGKNVQWEEVPLENWRLVRPLKDDALRFVYRPNGGSKDNLFAAIATVALAVASNAIGTAVATGLAKAGVVAAGSAGFKFAAGLTSAVANIGGSMALAKLYPGDNPRHHIRPEGESRTYEQVTSDSNLLAKEAYLPIVVGTRRVALPDVVQPRPYLEDGIECVDRVQAAWGPHSFSDVQVNGVPIETMGDSIYVEIREGHE